MFYLSKPNDNEICRRGNKNRNNLKAGSSVDVSVKLKSSDHLRGASIRIVNKRALEEVACECYGLIKEEYGDLYSDLSE
jgi:hypothetical protein